MKIFERVNHSEPEAALNAAFREGSRYVPTLSLILLNQAREITLLVGLNGFSIFLPNVTVHRPKYTELETAMDKVFDAVCSRTNSALGPRVNVLRDSVELMPFSRKTNANVAPEEKRRWPCAVGIELIPVIAQVEINGPDPKPRNRTFQAQPFDALGILQENLQEYRSFQTQHSLQALIISRQRLDQLASV